MIKTPMEPEVGQKFIEVIPYRNTGAQVMIFCLLFLPASLFMVYIPFRDPCSLDRTSGDCSLGSPWMEQIFTFLMISLGVSGILLCIYFLRRYYKNLIPHKGCRIAFTHDSIIGPIWGFWKSPEGEIKFSEIMELDIIKTRYGIFIRLFTPSRKMILQNSFLMQEESFKRIYNHLAKALGKPLFEEAASDEIKDSLEPFFTQIEKQKHLYVAFIYFAIGGTFTFIFGSKINNQHSSGDSFLSFLIPFSGFVYIVSKFFKRIWSSGVGVMFAFLFLMLFGLFLGIVGVGGILSI